jgi:hypothetical protein
MFTHGVRCVYEPEIAIHYRGHFCPMFHRAFSKTQTSGKLIPLSNGHKFIAAPIFCYRILLKIRLPSHCTWTFQDLDKCLFLGFKGLKELFQKRSHSL